MVDDAGAVAAARAAGRALRRALRAAPAPARPERRPQHRRRALHAASCSCSSTTTSASPPAGSRRCSTPPREHPGSTSSRARSEPAWRARRRARCGREGPPITTLDLGAQRHRRAATRGAPTWRSAARALERVGPFDASLEHGGDEQEWQERLRALRPRRARPVRRRRGASTIAAPAPTRACGRSPAAPTPAAAPRAASTPGAARRPRCAARAASRSPAASGTCCAAAARRG